MNQATIFAPMGAMAALTFAVLLLIPIRRFRAVGAGEVTAADFALGESARVSPTVALPNRNYMNLLEVPTLFYPVCLMFYVAHRLDATALVLAWAFVAARAAHSLVHLTSNDVRLRLVAFGVGDLVLIALWVRFFLSAGPAS